MNFAITIFTEKVATTAKNKMINFTVACNFSYLPLYMIAYASLPC